MEPIGGDVSGQIKSHVPPTVVKCILVGDKHVGKTSLVVSYTSNDYPSEYKPSVLDAFCVEVCAESRPVHLQICDAGGKAELQSLRQISYPGTHVILLCFSVVQPDSFRSLKTNWLNELANSSILLNPTAQLTAARLLNNQSKPLIPSNSSLNPFRNSSHNSKSNRSILSNSRNSNNSSKFVNRIPGPTFLLIGCACDLRNDISRLVELSQMGEEPVDKETAELLASELGAEAYVECSALTQKNLKTVFDLAIWFGLKVADSGGPADLTKSNNNDNITGMPPNFHTSFASSSTSLNCSSVCHVKPCSNTLISEVAENGLHKAPHKHESLSSSSLLSGSKMGRSKLRDESAKKGWKKFLCMV